jgi:hypothetical protein
MHEKRRKENKLKKVEKIISVGSGYRNCTHWFRCNANIYVNLNRIPSGLVVE